MDKEEEVPDDEGQDEQRNVGILGVVIIVLLIAFLGYSLFTAGLFNAIAPKPPLERQDERRRRKCKPRPKPGGEGGINERLTRGILQAAFKVNFPQSKNTEFLAPWLRSDLDRPLELDCFNEDMMVAVEYDGEYHGCSQCKYIAGCGCDKCMSRREFGCTCTGETPTRERSIELDAQKDQLCADNGVTLIRVSYHDNHHLAEALFREFSIHAPQYAAALAA